MGNRRRIWDYLHWRRRPVITEELALSPSRIAWQRFRNNPLAMTAVTFIAFSVLIAFAAYLITPDPTPFSNKQYLELARKKPGTRSTMLRVTKDMELAHHSWMHDMLFGWEEPWEELPVDSLWFGEGFVRYMPAGSLMERELPIAQVLFMLDPGTTQELRNDTVIYALRDGSRGSVALNEARQKVLDEMLVTRRFHLGSDRYGRDMLSQLIVGMRVSLSVGFVAVFISLVIGMLLGAMAGYFGGRIDGLIMWFVNVIWSMPSLLLVIAITFALGKGFWQVFIAIGLTMWVEVARVTRGQIISLREKEFIEAGKALGFGHGRILFRHVLPNVMSPVIVISAANFATAILLEAGLSFLGIGVQPPMPSWGSMIRDHAGYIILDSAYLAFLPGLAIMLMVLSFMVAGNGLRDALDVRSQ